MTAFNYQLISDQLTQVGADISSSELHGLMTGYMSATVNSGKEERLALYQDWLNVPIVEVKALEVLYAETLEALDEYSDFNFRLLIAADDEALEKRTRQLSTWCSGFLSGYGSAGRHDHLDEDITEALADLAKIAALKEGVADSEDNEADFTEILEYVRVSVLMIFTDSSSAAAPQ